MKPFWRSIFFKSAFGSTALSQSSSWWVSSPSAELHATDPTFYGNQKQPLSCFFFTPSFHVISAHVFSVLFLLEEFWKNNITNIKTCRLKTVWKNLGHYNGIIYIYNLLENGNLLSDLPPFFREPRNNRPTTLPGIASRSKQRGNSWPRSAVMLSSKLRRQHCQIGVENNNSWHMKHTTKEGSQETHIDMYICTQKKTTFSGLFVLCWCFVEFSGWLGAKLRPYRDWQRIFLSKMTTMESTNEKWPSELVVSNIATFLKSF